LPDENGLSLYTYFPNPEFEVIFISSGPEYAVQAIKQLAIDYLIKPVRLLDLKAALVRLEKRNNPGNASKKASGNHFPGTPFHKKIALPTSDGFQVVPYNEILYCQASENYSYIYTIANDTLLVSRTLKMLEEVLPSSSFFRIHKSILLNINYIRSFSRKDGFTVTLETGQKFEIAIRRHEEFVNLFIKKHTPLEI
jgi:two-component system LytT family response regulator